MRVTVVVVVPAFTESHQRQRKAVSAIIIGFETSTPKYMSERVDEQCTVKEKHRTDNPAPNEELCTAGAKSWSNACQSSPYYPER